MPNITNLQLASDNAISTALSNLRGSFNVRNCWLNRTNNKYIVDTLGELKRDFTASSIRHAEVVDYMASSVCIHCFNGWSYLSTAINSLMEGEYGNAIHNAYYAELRGIMSILSSQGIGVFDKYNVIVDNAGVIHEATPNKQRTHVFSKEAFDQWLSNPINANKILELITIENASLKQWTDSTGFSVNTYMPALLASNWLQNWSLDLNIIKGEQHFRNFVSYNPQTFDFSFSRPSDNIRDRLQFIIELWKLCSPNNLFSNSTLRISLEKLYVTLFGYPSLQELDIKADLEPLLVSQGMNPVDMKSQYLIKFLRREIEAVDNIVFSHAKNIQFSNPLLESDTEPMGIISRACLILLINTKIVETTLRKAGISKADLRFWLDNTGIKLGFWDSASPPYLLSDLWNDVELDINDIDQWIKKPGNTYAPFSFKSDLKASTSHIRHLGKAYMWGIGI